MYWYGKESMYEREDVVLSVVHPKAHRTSGNFEVSEVETTVIGHRMAGLSLVCLAQIHTHPDMINEHSSYDDNHAISRRNGFLSLVAVNYGNIPRFDLHDLTVHESWDKEWLVLNDSAKSKRIRLIDDQNPVEGGSEDESVSP